MIDPGLKEKVVLITGANNPHGIGAGIARAFAAQGAKVFLHYLRQLAPGASTETGTQADTPGAPFYYSQQAKSAGEVLAEIRPNGRRGANVGGRPRGCKLYPAGVRPGGGHAGAGRSPDQQCGPLGGGYICPFRRRIG